MIEQWFEEDDPQLANTLRAGPVRRTSTVPQTVLIVLACALGALGVVTGAFMLIFAGAVSGVVAACMVSNRRAKLRN